VQERKAPKQHPQHGVEGRAPHRAEAFVIMRKSEDRSLAITILTAAISIRSISI